MDWITGMQRALDHIEAHLDQPIDYAELAHIAASSPYHFQRVFGILCGMTLGEYIRCRRLTRAGVELAAQKIKVIDAAVKYGYDSPDSFTKAFARFHGITPSAARLPGASLRSFAPLRIKISLEGGSMLAYRIEEKPELILTGYKRRFTGVPGARFEQERDLFTHSRANQYLLQGLAIDRCDSYTVVTNVDDEGYDFWICGLLTDKTRQRMHEDVVLGEEEAKRFEHLVIPAHTYAVFETEHCPFPTEQHLSLRERIVSEWLPASGYVLADAPEIALYHWYTGADRANRYIELWLPVGQADSQ